MSELIDWVNTELEQRGWGYNELARRAGLSSGGISAVMTGTRKAGFEWCKKIALAFNVPAEQILYRAGLLPAPPPAVESEREALGLFRRLDTGVRPTIITMMRNLIGIRTTPAHTISEQITQYETSPPVTLRTLLAHGIERELRSMPLDEQDQLWDTMKRIRDEQQGDNGVPTNVEADSKIFPPARPSLGIHIRPAPQSHPPHPSPGRPLRPLLER